jgi:hypothetical protein
LTLTDRTVRFAAPDDLAPVRRYRLKLLALALALLAAVAAWVGLAVLIR